MAEEKSGKGPVKLWNQAVKAVKGENAGQLVEEFTAEMTLVAEGLVEDQARLRGMVEELQRSRDRETQSLSSELEALENDLKEQQREIDRRLSELSRRLDAMDKKQSKGRGLFPAAWMDKLLILAGIVCGSWVLVSIISLFR
ncbi:MAG: hypothetical protein J1E43_10995 [Christensenellaceae bacterium]|nr:hypothetical protein [Christensenellaceae bacterium]